jgi:hypothetical protein
VDQRAKLSYSLTKRAVDPATRFEKVALSKPFRPLYKRSPPVPAHQLAPQNHSVVVEVKPMQSRKARRSQMVRFGSLLRKLA